MKIKWFSLLLLLSLLTVSALADVEVPDTELFTALPAEGDFELWEDDGDFLEDGVEEPEEIPIQWDYNELTVGTVTPMTGAFFTSLWGNTTADIDVRMLLHGYNLVEWDSAIGGFSIDRSVVSGIAVTEDEAGNHIYNIALYSDLLWSDGTPVTAWDYAFSWMLTAWPGIRELGGNPVDRSYLLGMTAWQNGEADAIAGIRVYDDDQLALTVSADYLPFFFELGLLDCTPVPISAVAPGCRLADEGQGVTLAEGRLSVDLLRNTLLGDGGYITRPAVSCGPYRLESYDGQTASFVINANYKGDSQGITPRISRLILKNVDRDTMVSLLAAGEVGLLNKCANAETVTEGVALVGGSTQFAMTNYTRSGFGFLSFCEERPAMASQAVRRAVALCLDKDAAVAALTGSYGLRVDGYYGIGQWMVELMNGTLAYPLQEPEEGADAETVAAYEAELAEWEALSMESIPVLTLDVEEAIRLLTEDGWTQTDSRGIRRKRVNGEWVSLELKLLLPEGSAAGDVLREHFAPHLAEAGIALTFEAVPFDVLTERYYRHQPRDCDMIFLASNFDVIFDPSPQFLPGGDRNWTASLDGALYQLAVDMRKTEPGDTLSYCKKWLAFQQRFAEELPMLPIYSNVYFDFYPRVLREYSVNQNIGWSQAIVAAYLSDAPDEEGEEEPEEEDGDFVYFE